MSAYGFTICGEEAEEFILKLSANESDEAQ